MSVELLTTVPAAKAHHAKDDIDLAMLIVTETLTEYVKDFHNLREYIKKDDVSYLVEVPTYLGGHPIRGWEGIFTITHPNIEFRRREAERYARNLRLSGRGLQILRTVELLDMSNATHKRWFLHLYDLFRRSNRQSELENGEYLRIGNSSFTTHKDSKIPHSIFDPHTPWRTPPGIPVGTLTDYQKKFFLIEPSVEEVELVACFELEEGMGGIATMFLHDQLPDTDQSRLKTRARVETYLMKNRQSIPGDPWDPNHWGHDARLSDIVIKEHGTKVALTPAFDPEVLSYTINSPISGSTITVVKSDTFASSSIAYATDSTSFTITVTAKDGVTVRKYKVSVE